MTSASDALPTGAEGDGGDPAPGDGEESRLPATGKGRILLLEDDASFKEVIRDFLKDNGYTVIAVANGGEGVREVLGNDFSLILCDLMMPTLPGDMFYRAVQRIRPSLCERFVFMSGYRGDAKTNEFIRTFNVTVLRKPFHLKDLLDTIAFAEARSGLQEAFDAASAEESASPQACPPEDPAPVEPPLPPPPPVAEVVAPVVASVAAPVPSAQPRPLLFRPAPVLPANMPPAAGRMVPRVVTYAGIVLLLGLGFILGDRYLDARDGLAAAASERLTLETEWRLVSAQAEQAEKSRRTAASVLRRAKRIEAERAGSRWVEVLRAASIVAGPGIELRAVSVRRLERPAGFCEISFNGVASGNLPREVADEFQRELRRELERSFQGTVGIRLVKLEDHGEPAPATADQRRSSFTVEVEVGSAAAAPVERQAGK
ncbi:MAG: response regulator [Chthoniobacteraceae bacterium]